MTQSKILLTGGAGYIGSHTYLALIKAGYTPIILDDFRNSRRGVLKRIQEIIGHTLILEEGDICDPAFVASVFKKHDIYGVVHFAALKSVGESVAKPLLYYRNNIGGLITLTEAMIDAKCWRLIFSGSATVYGEPEILPITENAKLGYTNPYGHSKLVSEQILHSVMQVNPDFRVVVLRYFNPVGAHKSGLIGEHPQGIPNNVMPYITQVAIGKLPKLRIFGNDYETPDGTGVRDYIHVMDLAEGHVAALKYLETHRALTVNLGTGQGYSVLDLVMNFSAASGRDIPYEIAPRRMGDIASCYADVNLAKKELGWSAQYGIQDMCTDSWRWQSQNPDGFAEW